MAGMAGQTGIMNRLHRRIPNQYFCQGGAIWLLNAEPGIERAKFWREQNDGTVAFSVNGVDPIVTFGVADGDGYESYAPALPLLSLAAMDN